MNAPAPAKEGLPDEVSWVPRMDAIRKAQVAEVEALEEIVGTLASKQQSSIKKLRQQMDTIIAWKTQIVLQDRKVAARREAAKATNRENVEKVAGDAVNSTVVTTTDVTTTDVSTIEGVDRQSDAESSALVDEDKEDGESIIEEPIEQGWQIVNTAIDCV